MTLALIRSGVRVAVADLPASAAEVRELMDIAARKGCRTGCLLSNAMSRNGTTASAL